MNTAKKKFLKLFNVLEGEEINVIILFIIFFLIKSSTVLFENFSETMLLKRFGVQHLALLLFIKALFIAFVLTGLGQLIDRFSRITFLKHVFIAIAFCYILIRILVMAQLSLIYPFIYILGALFDNLFALVFWLLAGDIFDTRQSKRLFPLLSASGILGSIVGNFSSLFFVLHIAIDNILFISASLLFVAFLFLNKFSCQFSHIKQQSIKTKKKPSKIRDLLKISLLLKLLILIVGIPAILKPIIDYQFLFLANETYSSEQTLMVFWGVFKGSFNIILLIMQLFFTGKIFSHIGITRVLFFVPINLTLIFAVFLARFDMVVAIYAKMSTKILSKAFNNPAKKTLYGFFITQTREKVSIFMKAILTKTGNLLGSIILLIPILGTYSVNVLGFGIALIGLIAVILFLLNYDKILSIAISSRLIDCEEIDEPNTATKNNEKKEQSIAICLQKAYQKSLDLSVIKDNKLVEKFLQEQIQEMKNALLFLIIQDKKGLKNLKTAINSPNPRLTAFALERIEYLSPRKFRQAIVMLFEQEENVCDNFYKLLSLKQRTSAVILREYEEANKI